MPTPDVKPYDNLPILYINTADQKPVDQKEVYIDATAWFDANGDERYVSIGSEDSPLILGIRGRGNSSWLFDGPKPYKIKFDKKQSFFGLDKNKHWALLPISSYPEYYNNMIGFEVGRQLGLPFQPNRFLIQLVLNDVFVGSYMMSENIRIDEGRVEIFEQKDNNEDEATIPFGWLVEVDNYTETSQIRIPIPGHPAGLTTRITYHTPEILSEKQHDWLYNQFNSLTVFTYNSNRLDNSWENIIDIEDAAKFFIVQEILHNFDAYMGSCYLHKDIADEPEKSKWHFGPLWDMGWSLDRTITELMAESDDAGIRGNNFFTELIKFPKFMSTVRHFFKEYVEKQSPLEWIETFCESLYTESVTAFNAQKEVWPELGSKISNNNKICQRYFKSNLEYLQSRLDADLMTYRVSLNVIKERDERIEENSIYELKDSVSVRINGNELRDFEVFRGEELKFEFDSYYKREIKTIIVNGEELTLNVGENEFALSPIEEDTEITVVFGTPTFIPVQRISLNYNALELKPGESAELIATIEPSFASEQILKWDSDNNEIVQVDSLGTIVALKEGMAIVNVRCDSLSDTCRVTVTPHDIDYGDDEAEVYERIYWEPNTCYLKSDFENVEDINYWVCDNEDLISNEEDRFEVLKYGETTLRAKDKYGKTVAYYDIFICPLIYIQHPEGIVYSHHVLYGSRPRIYLGAIKNHKIAGLTHDNVDILDEFISEDGYYLSIKPITEDSWINIVMEIDDVTDTESVISQSDIRIYVKDRTVSVVGKAPGDYIFVKDILGKEVLATTESAFEIPDWGVFLINVENTPGTFKILLR